MKIFKTGDKPIKNFKIFIITAFALALTACSQPSVKTNSGNKQSLKADFHRIVEDNLLNSAHKEHIAANGGEDHDFFISNRLNNLTKKLVTANNFSAKTVSAVLLKSDSVNAYSLGSNSSFSFIYVTKGLVKFVQNDDQLAAVLAHEISHIILGHHLARIKSSGSKFNQRQELEADRYSIKLLKKAGFKVQQSIKLLERLDILQAKQKFLNPQDYPSNKKRIQNLNKVIAAI